MKRVAKLCALVLGGILGGGIAAAPAAWASQTVEPMVGTFTPAQLEEARVQFQNAPPPAPGWENVEQVKLEREKMEQGSRLLNNDDDATHYARGSTMIIHIFINDASRTWTGTQMAAAGADAATAKEYYTDEAPVDANLHFDHAGSNAYYYYNPTVAYTIGADGMTSDRMEDVLAVMGRTDEDGDGWIVDDFSIWLQSWSGGWDNVILCFEPNWTGRAWASYAFARTALYTDDTGNVFAHEWGHIFGACDEYTEGGHCNGTIDCGSCQSVYLDDVINNGNCQLASCPSDVSCIMINNTFNGRCWYTNNHWGWYDEDSDGLLDWVKRRTSGNSFVNIYEIPHNGYADWNNTTDGYVIGQQWNTWQAVGLRSPAGTDYDLRVYGENNHNYLLAGSSLGGDGIDIVVSDYNHDRPGNENIGVIRYAGPATNYKLHWESGTSVLYPDGVERAGTWQAYYVVRCWDVPLFGGETVSFTLDVTSGNLDLAMALFKSNGDYYHVGRSSAVWSRDAAGVGGTETWTYEVPEDDVYGLVVWSNSTVAGGFDIKIGPTPYTLIEETPFVSSLDLRLYNYAANASYWSIVGTRPESGTNASLRLFAESTYQTELETSNNYSGVEFVAADYNPGTSTDYLRVIRESGAGSHATEWEHDADLLSGVFTGTWAGGHVGKVWDVNLTAGQSYFLREYHSTGGSLDTGVYIFDSADGDRYKRRNQFSAGSNFRAPAEGGEWFSYTAPANDWYGITQIVNDESAGSYSLWFGPRFSLPEDTQVRRTEEVSFVSGNVNSRYWSVFAVRPYFSDTASLWLYADDAYTSTSLKASDQSGSGVQFVVGDFNHNALGTYYPRVRRTTGTVQGYDVEWEGGNESIVFTPGMNTSSDFVWPSHDVADVFDLYVDGSVPGGQDVRILVEDLGNDIDIAIAVFGSNGAEYWGTLPNAMASANANPTGGSETVTVHFDHADWYGIVIWSDDDVDGGGNYRVRIIDPSTVSVEDDRPIQFDLTALSANPFSESASVRYALPASGTAELGIYDIAGREVRKLVNGRADAGQYTAEWDGRDENGNGVPSGVYFARLRSGNEERRIKLVRSR